MCMNIDNSIDSPSTDVLTGVIRIENLDYPARQFEKLLDNELKALKKDIVAQYKRRKDEIRKSKRLSA
jgi:hypothetical protein